MTGTSGSGNKQHLNPETSTPLTITADITLGKDSGTEELLGAAIETLSDGKGEDITTINLAGKSALADAMVIVSGRSSRHIAALTDQLLTTLTKFGHKGIRPEGLTACEWVLVDCGQIIVHIFHPEVRSHYDLERLWSEDRPTDDDSQ